jgi:hypothetical protein
MREKCYIALLYFAFAQNEQGWHFSLCLAICFYFPEIAILNHLPIYI